MYIKKFDLAQINFKRTLVLAVLITAFIVGLLGTAVKAEEKNIINYENRPGSMMIKDNYGTILAVLNSGKAKVTDAGSAYFVVNTQTYGKVYLLNKADNTVKFIITSKYFKSHRATLHMLTDSDGILTNVSVTLRDYLGFIHEIPVMEFVSMVEDNLEAGVKSAEKALEAAIQSGSEAAVEAAEAAITVALKEFSAFEQFIINADKTFSQYRTSISREDVIAAGYDDPSVNNLFVAADGSVVEGNIGIKYDDEGHHNYDDGSGHNGTDANVLDASK